jgi:hypothetical protein
LTWIIKPRRRHHQAAASSSHYQRRLTTGTICRRSFAIGLLDSVALSPRRRPPHAIDRVLERELQRVDSDDDQPVVSAGM